MQGWWSWFEPQRAQAERNPRYEMVSFNIDPQWCGLLFSIYCRHEKGAGSFAPGLGDADAFAFSVAGPPLDVDLIAWAGTFGFEVCSLSATCDLIIASVKTTGVLILLGFGGFVCYKLLNVRWPRNWSDLVSKRPDTPDIVAGHEDFMHNDIKGRYFGPDLSKEASGSNCHPTVTHSNESDSSSNSVMDSGASGEDEPTSSGCNKSVPLHPLSRRQKSMWKRLRRVSAQLPSSRVPAWLATRFSSMIHSPNSPTSSEQMSLSSSEDRDKERPFGSDMRRSRLPRDESYDSLGFSRHMPRDGSFDSTCSELSFDFSLPEAINDTNTIISLDKLQQEIDSLKTNCLMMDEEFETIKCNRNFPGMSSLMKANTSRTSLGTPDMSTNPELCESMKQEKARACFAGLYSLTTIKNSTSSELSDSFPRGSLGSAESLDWDSPKTAASPAKPAGEWDSASRNVKFRLGQLSEDVEYAETRNHLQRQVSNGKSLDASDDELMENLQWDEEEMVPYAEVETAEGEIVAEAGDGTTDLPFNKMESLSRSCTISPCTERSLKMDSSGFGSQTMDVSHVTSDFEHVTAPWTGWSSEDSSCLEWDGIGSCIQPNRDASISSISELSTPADEFNSFASATGGMEKQDAQIMNIGEKVEILQYAASEWRGNTTTSRLILQGYGEIPKLLNLRYLRKIRGDNYCGIRAALFQSLSQSVTIGSGAQTLQWLTAAMDRTELAWLKDWSFANRLPYAGNNVAYGMQSCMMQLDHTVAFLSTVDSGDRAEVLADLLNADPGLDLHLVEAVKLQMLEKAVQLHQENSTGQDVPIFAMLMFARSSSQTPRDFMNNHLHNVGDAGGLEQVEMFLLGYTLGVNIQVIRPKAFGTQDFICSFPDWNAATWPQVVLVAEDDRHYNILVN